MYVCVCVFSIFEGVDISCIACRVYRLHVSGSAMVVIDYFYPNKDIHRGIVCVSDFLWS